MAPAAEGVAAPAAAEAVAALAGNTLLRGSKPLAAVYAGHQFGVWAGRLGDGRALLLGEVLNRHGQRRDIAFKGSGRTPFSRGGDGKAAIGPVLREVLIGEAMQALGIPTTRALCVTGSGAPAYLTPGQARFAPSINTGKELGVKFKPASANSLLRNNMLVYGFGGVLLPFVAIKALDLVVSFLMQV